MIAKATKRTERGPFGALPTALGMLALINALYFIDLRRPNWHQVILEQLLAAQARRNK